MDRSKVSVYVNPFTASATQDDVFNFVQPYQPVEIRLRCRNNDPHGAQVAFIDFMDEATAQALISDKNYSRFMGHSMRLRMAFANQNNNSNSLNNNHNNNSNVNRGFQENRGYTQNRNNQHLHQQQQQQQQQQQHLQGSPNRRSRLREIQVTQREIVRGTFTIIASVSSTQFVALETGWQSDMAKLAEGLEDYANYAKCGVDEMDPAVVYACKEPTSGKWRRCRKVADECESFVVELIDQGGPLVVSKDEVLILSQLYKDWSIKAVDVFLDGYVPASGAHEDFKKLEELLLNKAFQLTYMHERTGPLMRDCVRVIDMKFNGDSMLDQLVQKKLLLKRDQQQAKPTLSTSNGSHRPITKSSHISQNSIVTPVSQEQQPPQNTAEPPVSRVAPSVEEIKPVNTNSHPKVTKSASNSADIDWRDWNQGNPMQNNRNQKPKDGWGEVGLAQDDNGTEVWSKNNTSTNNQNEGWNECSNESSTTTTATSDANQTGWNIPDWSASPPRPSKAVAAAPSSPIAPAATTAGTEAWGKRNAPNNNQTEGWNETSDESTTDFNRTTDWNIQDWSNPSSKPQANHQAVAAAAPQSKPAAPAVQTSPAVVTPPAYRVKKCDDVFSDADEWNRNTAEMHPNAKHGASPPSFDKMSISDNAAKQCSNCEELSAKLQSLERLVFDKAAQKMVCDRISSMSNELNQLKMHITRLSLHQIQSQASNDELRYHRRTAQMCVQDLENVVLLASPDTLAVYGMRTWAQFVGTIWSPMMKLLYFNEKPISVYKNTVIRRAEIDMGESFEDEPQVTVILERAIEASKIFQFAQDLMTHKEAANVHRVFFSEDTSKAFVILECLRADDTPDEYGRRAVDFLLELDLFQ